ncbi:MAG: hypothetical protein U9R60_16380 [Bacteroidota bacterium]|nr:hypothetical protein [Bacteroidota bacterium]
MNRRTTYLLFGLSLLLVKLVINYHTSLIPGINGGYYPLQVRSLINTGRLGFPDLPLYFYINALIVKLVSFLTSLDINQIIIHTSKILDSISLPLFLIPLYLFEKNILKTEIKALSHAILILFVTLSFSPLTLSSELQKNAFAILLLVFYIYYLLFFIKTRSTKHLLLSVLFFILTGLTHVGVFAVSMTFLSVMLLLFYRRRALMPILGAIVTGISMVYFFDQERAFRLLGSASNIFEYPVILHPFSPLEALNYLLSYLLIGTGIYVLIKFREHITAHLRKMLIGFIILIFLLSFPLLDIEYARRFSLMLFIPQFIVLHILYRTLNSRLVLAGFSIYLIVFTGLAVFMIIGRMKPASITEEAFQDLKNIESFIEDPDRTLIIARHGLEWWTAWQLGTKVGQDKAVERNTVRKYDKMIVLVQLRGINQMGPSQGNPFHEPFFPTKREAFYVSDYFRATELKDEDFDRMPPPPPRR